MSETKHTPGPWLFDGDNPGNQGFDIAFPDGGVLASAYYCADGAGREVAEANARLIAAAPQLLEACRAARLALRATSRREKDYSHELNLLGSAVAKATGEGV